MSRETIMKAKFLTDTVSVSEQVLASEINKLAEQGFRSIICNRPNHESPDQPDFTEISRAAQAAGIEARFLPVNSGLVTLDEAKKFGQLVQQLPKPILAYCRSGTRSAQLWALDQADQGKDFIEINVIALRAGFNVESLLNTQMADAKKNLTPLIQKKAMTLLLSAADRPELPPPQVYYNENLISP